MDYIKTLEITQMNHLTIASNYIVFDVYLLDVDVLKELPCWQCGFNLKTLDVDDIGVSYRFMDGEGYLDYWGRIENLEENPSILLSNQN